VKKLLVLLSIILLILILFSIAFAYFIVRKPQSNKITTVLPITQKPVDLFSSSTSSTNSKLNNVLPLKTNDFEITYLPEKDKYQIIKKTVDADIKINQWLRENDLGAVITTNNSIVVNNLAQGGQITQGKNDPTELLTEFINVLFSSYVNTSSAPGNTTITPTNPSQNLSPTKKPQKTILSYSPPSTYNGLVYYPQCSGEYDDYPLPDGCTICKAGCGSTTVSMILASYVDKNYNPATVADLYGKNGYYLGCNGSGYSKLQSLFESKGLKTSDYIIANKNGYVIDDVAEDLKNYLNAGWTIFMLANFQAGDHYFWIVDIDANNNVFAFDPYYGRLTIPPFNENSYYPFPKYKVAFGVKK